MQQKYLINLISASLLWSLIPILATNLFDEVSLITIIFLRFLTAGLVLLSIAAIYIHLNNRYTVDPEKKIKIKKLLEYLLHQNKDFFNIRFIFYYCAIGFFGIILQVIFYFLALKKTTIAFTMVGYQISIILIAFYEHGVKSEKLDFFKILYLIILIFCIGIISYVQILISDESSGEISLLGFVYVVAMAICMTFLHISTAKASYIKEEIKFINDNPHYKLVKLFIRISLTFLTGILLMFPLLIILYFFPIQGDLSNEVVLFFYELTILTEIIQRWEILFLIVFSTIIPYILYFTASVNWNPYNLTFSQWESILTLIEPIGGIIFGVLIIGQNFPTDFLIIVIFLLAVSILFRFAHESRNKVNALILLNQQLGSTRSAPLKLLKLHGIKHVDSLVGTNDLLLNVKTSSIKELYYLINTELKKIDGIQLVEILFINKINKLEST